MKRLLKNNRGMTLMEILVALSLLMIVIVGTTPVMLQAYDGLYTAGEYTQDTYEAKSEIEEKLATRNTRAVYPGFTVNFNNLGEVATLNGRRAVSSLKGSLETLFTNARVRVAVISSKTVNDDYSMNGKIWTPGTDNTDGAGWHEVILQTTNLDFGTVNKGEAQAKISINNEAEVVDGDKSRTKIIDITFILPDKTADDASIYTYKTGFLANVDYNNITVDPVTGRITVRINGFDFTQSPIKIYVSYLDENDKKQTTETYLFVDTPTIIAAGETGTYDYYTSPGFVQKTRSKLDANGNVIDKEIEESFAFYGRFMRINETNPDGNYTTYTDPLHDSTVRIKSGASAIKDGTIIRNVTWVDNDTTTNSVEPYYVLTGTNGAIYRTYSLTGSNTALTDILEPVDRAIIINERSSSKTIYPALWGGDKAHQFGYSTYGKSMVYDFSGGGSDVRNGCWYTEAGPDTGVGHDNANAYSTSAEYSYYYNGWGQTYAYMSQKSRKISYILTEHGLSLRLGGYLAGEADHHKNYNLMWENLNNINYPTSYTQNTGFTDKSRWDRRDFYHPTFGESVVTAVWGSDDKEQSQSQDCPLYLNDKTGLIGTGTDGDMFADIYWGNIRIKYLSNMPLDYFHASGRRGDSQDGQSSSVRFLQHDTWNGYDVYDPKITVTDAVYLPALGSMFYVGSVAADAYLQQNDNLANSSDWVKEYHFQPADSHGAITTYLVRGNEDSTATEVHKYSYPQIDYNGYDFEWSHYNALVTDYYLADKATMAKIKTSDANNVAEEFFVTRPATPNSKLFTDVLFTLGFSSNREYVYSEIVYGMVDGALKETYKSYEHYYFKSHYAGDTKHIPNAAIVNNDGNSTLYSQTAEYLNKVNNDYYNVWFPGEMYNITKVATKEGVTVGTGYAVSGSTYQFVLGSNHTNTSTALGGIFNDGVLACSIDDNETSFENLLYFKDNGSFDGSYLGNQAGYSTAYPNGYGTHSRDSVQFTAVDIGVQYTEPSDNVEKATFYAYYADNKGRVFRSKIATRTTNMPSDYDPDDEDTNESYERSTPVKVNYISDIIVQPGDSRLADDTIGYMEQLSCHPTIDFNWLFSKITSIKVEGNYLIVSGHPNQANAETIDQFGIPVVVGLIDENTGNITKWNISCIDAGEYSHYCNVEDMLVLDGRVYAAGAFELPNDPNPGFVAILDISEVRAKLDDDEYTPPNNIAETKASVFPLVFVQVPDKLYAIDGHN